MTPTERAERAVDQRIINLARRLRPEQKMTVEAGDILAFVAAIAQAVAAERERTERIVRTRDDWDAYELLEELNK